MQKYIINKTFVKYLNHKVKVANVYFSLQWGTYTHPIYSETGDYPPILKQRVAVRSAEQGFARSRLPGLTPEEIEYIKGSSDYFGLNHYSTIIVYRNESVSHKSPSYYDDLDVSLYQSSEWEHGASSFMKVINRRFIITKKRNCFNLCIICMLQLEDFYLKYQSHQCTI